MGDLDESFFSRAGIGGACAMGRLSFLAGAGREAEPGDGGVGRVGLSRSRLGGFSCLFLPRIFSQTSFPNPFSVRKLRRPACQLLAGAAVCRNRTPGTQLTSFSRLSSTLWLLNADVYCTLCGWNQFPDVCAACCSNTSVRSKDREMGTFVQLLLQQLPSPGKTFMRVQRRYCLHSVWQLRKGHRYACFVFHSLERFGIHHNSTYDFIRKRFWTFEPFDFHIDGRHVYH